MVHSVMLLTLLEVILTWNLPLLLTCVSSFLNSSVVVTQYEDFLVPVFHTLHELTFHTLDYLPISYPMTQMTLLRAVRAKGQKREDMLFRKFTFETTLVSKRRRRVVNHHSCVKYITTARRAYDHLNSKKLRHQLHLLSTAPKRLSMNSAVDSNPSNKNCDAKQLDEPLIQNGSGLSSPRESSDDSQRLNVAQAVSRRTGNKSDCSDDTARGVAVVGKDEITNPMRLLTVKAADDDRSRRPLCGRAPVGRPRLKVPNKVAFPSVEEGIQQGRLFHTISQTPLRTEALDMDDSDIEDVEEKDWRFRLRRDEIVEYVDTLPAESLFMNLWNQFVGMEYNLDSDQQMSSACDAFIKSRLIFSTTFLLEGN